jgi:hypothetical protein
VTPSCPFTSAADMSFPSPLAGEGQGEGDK